MFDPPEPQKSSSRLGAVLFFTNSCFPPGAPKKHPKLTSKLIQKATQEVSGGPEMSIQKDLGFKLHFQSILGRFWNPKSDPEIDQKSVLGGPGRPRDAEGCPEASREPFWSRLGPILERFWEPCWGDLGTFFPTWWPILRYTSPLRHLPTAFPNGSQGRRVPASALTIFFGISK